MCGIAAIYGSDDDERGRRMLQRLEHRGPDEQGEISYTGRAWLGHTRLSIVDLHHGRQPFTGDGTALVCNGEIYNHRRLRATRDGHTFSTLSDCEVALPAVRSGDLTELAQLEGMWALCAVTPDGFVAARDPLGIKPLYWAHHEGLVLFASEMKAFDPDVLPDVEAFPPGHVWTPQLGLRRFSTPVPVEPPAATVDGDALTRTREVLVDSVHRHLMADVDVGVFLSGGLDSSLIAAIASRRLAEEGRPLRTFAVGTPDSSDLLAAREVAELLGTDHHEATFDTDDATAVVEDVVTSVESFDASLIRSAVPNWFLSQLAARHVKTVLTGEGADELFAGYGYYHATADPADLHAELVRTLQALHGLNLQRCDRVTMAHGLEARVPFLDRRVIAHAMALPPEVKSTAAGELEKDHLRRAFTGWLPEHLLWRRKEQFGTGSGAQDALAGWADTMTESDLAEQADVVEPPLRTTEELGFYRIFAKSLPGLRPDRTLTRFATA